MSPSPRRPQSTRLSLVRPFVGSAENESPRFDDGYPEPEPTARAAIGLHHPDREAPRKSIRRTIRHEKGDPMFTKLRARQRCATLRARKRARHDYGERERRPNG